MLTTGINGALLDRETAQVFVRDTETLQQCRTEVGMASGS
jgi:hypothetical protein